jgi:hypothetical protein
MLKQSMLRKKLKGIKMCEKIFKKIYYYLLETSMIAARQL